MSTLKQATIDLEGTRNLLINAFFVSALSKDKKEKTGSAGNDPEEWKRTIHIKEEDNQLFLPGTYFFSSFCHGAKYIKFGRGSIQPKVASTLQVVDEEVLLDRFIPQDWQLSQDSKKPVFLDIRGVKNPSTRGKNARYRVALRKDWKCSLSIYWDSSIVSVNEMHSAIIHAGSFVGLGDGRTIGFGRFKVSKFEHKTIQEPI
ncbi:MAG: hypothetical protein COT84_06965 [Chlamydiae bacterium CG10_big_fil_rev_8_21_14_0_10_35_9]|nr:MAG: hypothetical protein COT84_06965 [Chlamydiae bacterium CG10_big_fil_rev_8_21_14_0_10_35_9]